MSFWIHTKGKNEREHTLLVDASILLPILVIIALSCQVLIFNLNKPTRLGWHGMVLMLAGLVGLLVAKSSRFRQREWLSRGSKTMSKPFTGFRDVLFSRQIILK